jgi:ubiquinone/menaquinone biosynthesis C-methylase UbiE
MTEPARTAPASLSFDRIADAYDRTRGGMGRGRRFAEELAPFFDPGRPLFEVGIGTGLIALGLRELGFGVAGVDLSEAMARTARARIGPSVALGDARRLPVRDHALPQAFSVWVLHVVGDPGGVLAEVARVLAPSGRYAVIPGFSAEPGDPIGKAILEMQLRADPHGHRRDDEEHLRGPATAVGLRLVLSRPLAMHDYEESPADALRKIEARSYSWLWDLSDAGYAHAVEPAVRALRSLPDPERPIQRRSSGRLLVFEPEP